jgi:hypothetical protein
MLVLAGAVCGLAWAGSLRTFMTAVAGPASTVEWFGTFEGILLPGAVAGGLLGWAEHLRRTGAPRGWLAAAPLVFVLATPSALVSVVTDGGIGGGAIAVPLFGMAGGYALAGRGPRPARWAAAAFALLPVPAWLIGAPYIADGLALTTPRGAWAAVLFLSLLAVLALGCAIPLRDPDRTAPRPGLRLVLAGVVCGLAWAAGMRGFMAQAAGPESVFSWFGTFGILLPAGALVGGLFGRAEHLRRTVAFPRGRRLTLAPLVFAADPFALILVLPAMAGGYALAGRGSRRGRWAAAASTLVPVLAYVTAVLLLDDIHTLVTPGGAFMSVLLFSCYAVLVIACAIPHRAIVAGTQELEHAALRGRNQPDRSAPPPPTGGVAPHSGV